jgi:hypothetical protein
MFLPYFFPISGRQYGHAFDDKKQSQQFQIVASPLLPLPCDVAGATRLPALHANNVLLQSPDISRQPMV